MDENDNDESMFRFELSPSQISETKPYHNLSDSVNLRNPTGSASKRRRVSKRISCALDNVLGVAQSASIIRLKPKSSSPHSFGKKRKRAVLELDFANNVDDETTLDLMGPGEPSGDCDGYVFRQASPFDMKNLRGEKSTTPSCKQIEHTLDDNKEKDACSALKQIMKKQPHLFDFDSTCLGPDSADETPQIHELNSNARNKENTLSSRGNIDNPCAGVRTSKINTACARLSPQRDPTRAHKVAQDYLDPSSFIQYEYEHNMLVEQSKLSAATSERLKLVNDRSQAANERIQPAETRPKITNERSSDTNRPTAPRPSASLLSAEVSGPVLKNSSDTASRPRTRLPLPAARNASASRR